MKEICGFLDEDDVFHKTKKECEIANIKIKIRSLTHNLNNFKNKIFNEIKRKSLDSPYYKKSQFWEEAVTDIISNGVLNNFSELEKLIKEKNKLKEELDFLQKSLKHKPWWLKVKWW